MCFRPRHNTYLLSLRTTICIIFVWPFKLVEYGKLVELAMTPEGDHRYLSTIRFRRYQWFPNMFRWAFLC